MSYFAQVKVQSAEGNIAKVNSLGQFHTVMRSEIDADNSSTVLLLANEQLIGLAKECLDYVELCIATYSDVASAANGLCVEFSDDGILWIPDPTCATIRAAKSKTFTCQLERKYYRVLYTNGPVNQTIFGLSSLLRKTRGKPSAHNVNKAIEGDDDAELVIAVVKAQDENDDFVNIRAVQGDTGYNLKVSLDQVEPTTNSVQTIDYSHGELHNGTHYVVRNTALLAKAGTKDILIVTPNTTKWAHMIFGYEANDAAVVGQFFEAPTYSAIGTLDGARNRNRNVADNNTTLVYNDPVITVTGTLLTTKAVGSGKNSGGGTRDNAEFILKQNTVYLLRITEGNIAATNINWELDWYEHVNKN